MNYTYICRYLLLSLLTPHNRKDIYTTVVNKFLYGNVIYKSRRSLQNALKEIHVCSIVKPHPIETLVIKNYRHK